MAAYDHSYDSPQIILSNYASTLSDKLKAAYLKKLEYVEHDKTYNFADPYAIEANEWTKDRTMWPAMVFKNVSDYLTTSEELDANTHKNYRALAAYDYVISGKVSDVFCHRPRGDLNMFCILAADVKPSQRLADKKVFKTWVIAQDSGIIRTAHCTCMAGFGESCSHVAAILFKVEAAVRTGETKPAPTDSLCQWNNNFSSHALSRPMADINLKKRKWRKPEKPRKVNLLPKANVSPIKREKLLELKRMFPDAAFAVSLISDSSETDTATETEEDIVPPTVVDLIKIRAATDRDRLRCHFNSDSLKNLEMATKSQSNIWLDHKKGRLTSSNFGVILKRKQWSDKFCQSVLFPHSINTPAIKWGKTKEKLAIEEYVEQSKNCHVGFKYEPSGLVVALNDPHLGASPDGKIKCECCGEGVLEIKCPFKHKEVNPRDISKFDGAFCLNAANDLKETHNYYYQVQGQMSICKVSYCDFVIWTNKGLLINRVYLDTHFMPLNKPLLDKVYDEICLPYLLKHL